MSWSNRAGRKLPVAIFVLVLAAVAAAVLLPSASAVVTAPNSLGMFQLDGNATTDPSPPAPAGEDWDKVYANTGSYFSHVFVGAATEAPANDVTYFQGGGSKDTNDIPQWAWGPTNVTPDKTEILDAYGASYIDPTSKDTIVYFGMDRFDTSGDSNVGFWFLKDPTFGLVGTGSGTFSGQHQDGDLFVLSQFTTGGTVPTIQVYEWQNGALILKSSGTGCTTDNVACAAVNGSSSIQVPWPYQDKGGDAAGTVPATGFFEGGIDLNSIFGGSVPCFSNFLGETRSSQSTSAQLKDFAIGQINSCGSITIVKNASPTDASASFGFSGSGPDPKVGNFSLDGSNGSGARQSFESIHPGSYTFDESNIPAHWQFDHISCDSTQSTNGSQLTINLAAGQNVTCTYYNTRKPTLTLKKNVVNDDGGTADASAWLLAATGTGGFSGHGAPATGTSASVGPTDVNAGVSYALSESGGPSGYDAGSWSCDGGTMSDATHVTLAAGDNVTCSITNDDQAPKLVVIKHVVNDNGGTKAAGDFTMSVTGTNATPASFAGDEHGTNVSLSAGSYSVDEGAHDGYSKTLSADCSGTIALGETKTCTITNDDIAPKLVVIKHVINDNGGTKTAGDFTMSVAGSNVSNSSFAGDEHGTTVTLDAGSYSVDEGAHNGYAKTLSADCSGTIAPGETKTCTVTNDDIQPKLVVIKHVVNDNGGSKTAADFTMAVTGTNASPASFPGDEQGTNVALDAGSYSVDEGAHDGYTKSLSADCSGTIAVGETKTCTVTNDDIAPTLTLVKHVTNDNGGTATADQWKLAAAGSGGIAATNGTLDQSGAGVVGPKDVTAGVAYTLSESGGPSGYAASAWSCVQSVGEGTSPVDLSGTGKDQLTLAVGQHVTCSITNNDIQPKLVVVKHVINDDGGTKSASDFTLAVTGPNASPASFAGSEQGTNVALDAGTYSVAEGDHSGYTESTQGDCSGTIGAGETKTCTIVNDDIASPPPPQPTPPATPTPPPPPPAPVIDLQITKTDSPDPDLIGKTLRYRIVVKNNGPDTAHNVQMSDPLPVEVTFSSVTTTQGTCTGGQLVSCQLGTLEPNASATITIYVKPRQTGIVTNTATTVGSEAESNTANNTATATTLVTAPFKPPVVNACYAVAITPHQLTAGKRSILVLRVKTNGKPAKGVRVLVTGPGVRKLSGPTNAQGIVRVTVKPAKPGILRFQPMAHKGCSAPRIGVIGAFTPPVTG